MADTAVHISTSLDPQLNLALEESLFRNMQPGSRILLLYRNNPSVIIGRNQNPWLECSLKHMKKDKVQFFRRFSGGGTVYHDPGNINYSYMTPRQEFNRSTATGLIAKSLQLLGIQAEISPRNDILVHSKKISGSAYRITGDKAYHHGTLLVNADLDKLAAYLIPGQSVSEAKGTKSISSSVTNLTDCNPAISYENIYSAVAFTFTKKREPAIRFLDETAARKTEGVNEIIDQLSSLEWKLGKTPHFTITAACRTSNNTSENIPAVLEIVKGKIQTITILKNDYMDITEQSKQLTELLNGTFFRIKDISEILSIAEHEYSADQKKFFHSLIAALSEIIS
ncbi:MAG: lipoate--protein ligase [Bacteroidetes bacterium]|nr:lipoate--protein ligase [Bacteroidota bacterium]